VGWALGDFGLGFGFRDHWIEDRSLSDTEDPDFGKYDSDAQALDDVLYDNPSLLSIWAAGNDRDDGYTDYVLDNGYATIFSADPGGTRIHPVFGPGWFGPDWYLVLASGQANTVAPPSDGNAGSGFDSLPGDQTAKNSLVIGAIDDITVDPYDNTDVSIAAFSSFGAPDDGRIKPDLVANGVGVLSSVAFVPGTTIPSNVRYDSFSGTSMAAPNTTGSAALLLEHYRNLFPNGPDPDSATLKGLLIQTAFDAGRTGPDYENGWGVVDAAAAANFLTEAVTAAPTNLLSEMTYRGYDTDTEVTMDVRSDGSEQLKVTIVWTDPAPDLLTLPDPNVLDDPTSVLVNDLDLWVTGPGGTYWPWTLDLANPTAAAVRTTANSRDNVEQVLIDAPAGGIYTIHVGATENDPFTQDFSLLVDGVEATSTAPRVTAVIVGTDPVTSHGDYAIPTGSGNQLKSVPVGLANTIAIEFSEAVAVSQGQLTLASALQGGADPGSSTAFSGFDAETKTATWTFNTFLLNQLELTLSDGITDTANRPLDGNFTSPDTIFDPAGPALTSLASGDGTTGGPFSFRFTVLPGDLNGDTEIDYADLLVMNGNNEMTSATYQDGDVNGDGTVNQADYDGYLKPNYGTILAVWEWRFLVSDLELDQDVDFDDIDDFVQLLREGTQAYIDSHSGLPPISNDLLTRLVKEMIGDANGDDYTNFDDIPNLVATFTDDLLPENLGEL
ncbi:MAG: S8 family serine peptidase, partial [Pirellulaceae bacterium]